MVGCGNKANNNENPDDTGIKQEVNSEITVAYGKNYSGVYASYEKKNYADAASVKADLLAINSQQGASDSTADENDVDSAMVEAMAQVSQSMFDYMFPDETVRYEESAKYVISIPETCIADKSADKSLSEYYQEYLADYCAKYAADENWVSGDDAENTQDDNTDDTSTDTTDENAGMYYYKGADRDLMMIVQQDAEQTRTMTIYMFAFESGTIDAADGRMEEFMTEFMANYEGEIEIANAINYTYKGLTSAFGLGEYYNGYENAESVLRSDLTNEITDNTLPDDAIDYMMSQANVEQSVKYTIMLGEEENVDADYANYCAKYAEDTDTWTPITIEDAEGIYYTTIEGEDGIDVMVSVNKNTESRTITVYVIAFNQNSIQAFLENM